MQMVKARVLAKYSRVVKITGNALQREGKGARKKGIIEIRSSQRMTAEHFGSPAILKTWKIIH